MEYYALKDVCKITMGQSPYSSSYNDQGEGLPFFQGNADFGNQYPVTRVWCSSPTKVAQPDDILISVRAPIGALNYAKEKCCIGRGLAALTPNKNMVSPDFIFWLLKGKKNELNAKGTGSTFKAINRKVLEDIKVPRLGLKKQQEHANNLQSIWEVIQKRKDALSQLDMLVQARFVEMFGEIGKDTKGWGLTKLGRVCELNPHKPKNLNDKRQ
ncbi:MAG: restriction endonuclease subunit S, partial [Succiniclasticum sp.]